MICSLEELFRSEYLRFYYKNSSYVFNQTELENFSGYFSYNFTNMEHCITDRSVLVIGKRIDIL